MTVTTVPGVRPPPPAADDDLRPDDARIDHIVAQLEVAEQDGFVAAWPYWPDYYAAVAAASVRQPLWPILSPVQTKEEL